MAVKDYLETMDFTTLRKLILDMAPEDVDKSEGSFMYDAVTPIALFVSQVFDDMKIILEQSFIETATGTNLDNIAATMPRIYRRGATPERLMLRLSPSIPEIYNFIVLNQATLQFSNEDGERFSVDNEQDDWLTSDETNIYVRVYKSVMGRGASVAGQQVQPIPAISGLESCQIHSVTAGGGDAEDDDHFRVRVWASMSSPFLGSVADYQRKIFSEFPFSENGFNVENCFIIPRGSRSGYICVIPAKSGEDGSVQHCTIGELQSLQDYLDKRINNIGGYGMGVAPIGHVVKVRNFSDYRLHQQVRVIVANGKLPEVPKVNAEEQIVSATNVYLRSIINETVPSAANYMANAQRYVKFFIYYYVNAHEYAVLSALRKTFGNSVIKNIAIERVSVLKTISLDDISVTGVANNIVYLYQDGEPVLMSQMEEQDISKIKLSSTDYDFEANGEVTVETHGTDQLIVFKENGNAGSATVSGARLENYNITTQTDLVISSGDSKGTLPVIGNLNVVISEAET
jgi:hypothetical protein